MKALFCACLLILLIAPARAALPETVQVRLFSAYPPARTVILRGPFHVTLQGPSQGLSPVRHFYPAGSYRFGLEHGHQCFQQQRFQHQCISNLVLTGPPSGIGVMKDDLPIRYYPGQLILRGEAVGMRIINRLPAKTYVQLVVASETMPHWPDEALKAQAVLTQTRLRRYAETDCLEDSTAQEAYLGLQHQRPEVGRAVAAVWGQTLRYQGRPIVPFYHASCGGRTSDGRFLNTHAPPAYLDSVICPYCAAAPFSEETIRIIPKQQWESAFPDCLQKNCLPKIQTWDAAGRPLEVSLGNHRQISGYAFWLKLGQTFGWDKAPGTRFRLTALPDGNIQIRSTGAGHGLGLCQWGARNMAQRGMNYRQILKFYFPKTTLK